MPTTLPDLHVANAHRRLPSTGQTRFQEAIEAGNPDMLEWAALENCPWDRRSKEGEHPLISCIQLLGKTEKSSREPVRDMPDWWTRHGDDRGHVGWVAWVKEYESKRLQDANAILDRVLAAMSWKGWSAKDTDNLLRAISFFQGTSQTQHTLALRAIQAGWPLDALNHEGQPMTPAMWAAIHTRSPHLVQPWLDEAFPIDPPGKGPGFLSAWLLIHPNLSRGDHAAELTHAAIARGADVNRPVCPIEWDPHASSFKREQANKGAKTLLAQARAQHDSTLVRILCQSRDISEKARIETLGDFLREGPPRSETPLHEEFFRDVLAIFPATPARKNLWKEHSVELLEAFITGALPRVCSQQQLGVGAVYSQLLAMGVDPKAPMSEKTMASAVHTMSYILTGPQIAHALSQEAGILTGLHIEDGLRGFDHAVLQLARVTLHECHRADKIIPVIEKMSQTGKLSKRLHSKVDEMIFGQVSSVGLSRRDMQWLLEALQLHGWSPHPAAWTHLWRRMGVQETQDSPEILLTLSKHLAEHTKGPQDACIFDALERSSNEKQAATSYREQYKSVCHWNHDLAQQARQDMVQQALSCMPDINAVLQRKDDHPISALEQTVEGNLEPEEARARVEQLFAMGANPREEEPRQDSHGSAIEWMTQLPSTHWFVVRRSQWEQEQLEQGTRHVPARARRRL